MSHISQYVQGSNCSHGCGSWNSKLRWEIVCWETLHPYLSFASAITRVRGFCAFLLGLSTIWASSFPNSYFSSGYSSGRVSRTEGCQVRRGGSDTLRSWLPENYEEIFHILWFQDFTFQSTDIVWPELCLLCEGDVLGVGGEGGHGAWVGKQD